MTTEHDEILEDYPDETEELDLDALGWVPKQPIQNTWAEPLFWAIVAVLMTVTPQWVQEWVESSVSEVAKVAVKGRFDTRTEQQL